MGLGIEVFLEPKPLSAERCEMLSENHDSAAVAIPYFAPSAL
jgi:hypothetical protein